jgi:hypothetical protein
VTIKVIIEPAEDGLFRRSRSFAEKLPVSGQNKGRNALEHPRAKDLYLERL